MSGVDVELNKSIYLTSFNLNIDVKYPIELKSESTKLNYICRFCLLDCNSMKYLTSEEMFCGETHQIMDYFNYFIQLEMFEEEYLNKTCEDCLNCAKFIYCFKKQCESASVSLKEYLIKIITKEDCTKNNSNNEYFDQISVEEDVEYGDSNNSNDSNEHCNVDSTVESNLTLNVCQQNEIKNNLSTKVKKELCTQCGKTFARKTDLTRHILSHSQAKPHKCNKCPKGFNQHYALVQHLLYHAGKSSFICDICGKGFFRKASLKQHLRLHNGVKKYNCNICQSAFATNAHLVRHLRIHSGERPFKCEACGKSFTTQTGYVVHSRSHTKIKPYKCQFCDKAFTTSSALKVHTRNHTGERPYKCEKCDATFTRSDLRNIHVKSGHR